VPAGKVAKTAEAAEKIAASINAQVVVKAQVLVGGRGKAGGVKLANTPQEAKEKASQILGMNIKGLTVTEVLVTQAVDIKAEYYTSCIVDRDKRSVSVIFSPAGGIDIEEVAAKTPEKIFTYTIDALLGLQEFNIRNLLIKAGVDSKHFKAMSSIISKLYKIQKEKDASLVEVNPLVETKQGEIVCVDAKVILDDNALYRQPEFAALSEVEEGIHPLEQRAKKEGLTYVKLEGNIGVIGNGAGLVMGTMDLVKQVGGKPANFLDIGGGAKAEIVRKALEQVLADKQVQGIFINIFGGITRGDEVAKGILEATSKLDIKVPLVIRLTGTNAEEGRKILQGSKLVPCETMEQAAKKIVELASRN